jgi:predicted negative regulator of RcsB-dependent stress response
MKKSFLHSVTYSLSSHMQQFIIAGALVLGLLLAGGGYWWYQTSMNEAAQGALAQCLEEYERALHTVDTQSWHDVQMACAQGYALYKNSSVAPFFLALQSDAYLYQNDKEQAYESLRQAVASLSKKVPLYYLYATKLALLEHDIKHDNLMLDMLAMNSKNPYQDMAYYYRGYFAWSEGNEEQARKDWDNIIRDPQSIWAQRAQAHLSYIE